MAYRRRKSRGRRSYGKRRRSRRSSTRPMRIGYRM